MDRRMADALDNWITGHYGEDQFKHEKHAECGNCAHFEWSHALGVGMCKAFNFRPGLYDPACEDFMPIED